MTINLGDKCKDRITGFTGTCVAKTQWLYGCMRITIQPDGLHDGKPIDAHTFDEPQIELIETSVPVAKELTKTGGPIPTPKTKTTPSRR